jgi:hypothetical protein
MAFLGAAGAQAALTFQDFDGGGTAYTATKYGTDPGPTIVTEAAPINNFLRLAANNVGNQRGGVGLDRTHVGAFTMLDIQFDFRMGPANGADGLGFAVLNTANYGTTGSVNFSEEPNLTGSFGVGLDIHDNGANDASEDSVSLHWNGALLTDVDVAAGIDLENNVWNRADIQVRSAVGGSNVWVTLTPDIYGVPGSPVAAFSGHFIEDLYPYEGRLAFAARTGGLNANHDIDNIRAAFVPEPASMLVWGLGMLGLLVCLRRRR